MGATLEALAEDAVDVLASILKYHVLAAPVFSSNLTDDGVATSPLTNSEGTAVPLIVTLMDGVPNEMIPNAMENVTDGSIYVNNAKITGPDVAVCSDGSVIHLIDTVLLPPAGCGRRGRALFRRGGRAAARSPRHAGWREFQYWRDVAEEPRQRRHHARALREPTGCCCSLPTRRTPAMVRSCRRR